MKVYKCVVTGDELFTDTYPIESVGGLYRIRARHVTRSEKFDDSKLGANPSAEEVNEGTEDSSISGIDVVLDNRLQKTGFGTKKEFITYCKGFVKLLEETKKSKNPEIDIAKWRAGVQEAVKTVLEDFKNYEFYTGESCNPDGSIGLVRWETPEGQTDDLPFIYFFIEGVKEEKF